MHTHRSSSIAPPPRDAFPPRIWIVFLLVSLGFLIWINGRRIERIERVTAIAQESLQISEDSATGYARGTRAMIVPERLTVSHECIILTQQMLAGDGWRVRHFDQENAPFGRPVHSTSPYRWWLALVATAHHAATGQPLGLSVERAALYADPLLHALWLIGATLLVVRFYGARAGSLIALGGATVFPFAAAFLPGVPEERALAWVVAIASVLPLLAAWRSPPTVPLPPRSRSKAQKTPPPAAPLPPAATRWFALAGVIGGLGVWNYAAIQVPVLIGITVGALAAAWIARDAAHESGSEAEASPPWRVWAGAGAITIVAAWLLEYFPIGLASWELRSVHPLYAVAWLGAGELLRVVSPMLLQPRPRWTAGRILTAIGSLAAMASVPAVMAATANPGFLFIDTLSFRVSKQIDAVILPNLSSWIAQDGLSSTVGAVLLSVAALAVVLVLAARRQTARRHRQALAVMSGAALAATGLAYFHLGWWQIASALSWCALAVAVGAVQTGTPPRMWRWIWTTPAVAMIALGAYHLLPGKGLPPPATLSVAEAEAVVGRHLAHWLARRSNVEGGAIVLAPPGLTSTLNYHGGLRGLPSLSWENKDGLAAAIRLVISTSRDETHALIHHRGVNYIVLPSWDPFFDAYVRSASVQVGSLFLPGLQRWIVPPWLRPVPFEMPKIPGFEKHTVVVFEVVDEQDEPAALSRLTEYFIEMSQPENALAAAQALRRFPADLGALIARAQLESALGQPEAFAATIDTLTKRLTSGGGTGLEWDRRVSLASILARAKRYDQARDEVKRCLAEIDEPRIRSLTPYGLYHFLGLCKGFGLPIADTRVRDLALESLPVKLRSGL